MRIIDFGLTNYLETLELQRSLFDKLQTAKQNGSSIEHEILLIGEHRPVITCGFHANKKNIITPEKSLKEKNIEIIDIERGGDVTFHAPGQLIAYPIIDLSVHSLGVKNYITILEECVIRLLSIYGIKGQRIEGATGVWLDKAKDKERKICAIGVKCRKFCTMHGLALNVNNDLDGFALINPCGFTDKGVASISNELGEAVDFEMIKKQFSDIFLSLIFSL